MGRPSEGGNKSADCKKNHAINRKATKSANTRIWNEGIEERRGDRENEICEYGWKNGNGKRTAIKKDRNR